MRRKLPAPELVTCETPYGAAYSWKIEAHGIMVLGNTKLDCQVEFQRVYESEYGQAY